MKITANKYPVWGVTKYRASERLNRILHIEKRQMRGERDMIKGLSNRERDGGNKWVNFSFFIVLESGGT